MFTPFAKTCLTYFSLDPVTILVHLRIVYFFSCCCSSPAAHLLSSVGWVFDP